MLVVTCIFPSLWKDWFQQLLADRVEWKSVQERFAQQKVELDRFSAEHGVTLLASRLDSSFTKHGLPSNVYPFTEDDIQSLCSRSTSPREFLQSANELFQKWLDGDAAASTGPAAVVVTQDSIDALIRSTQVGYESEYRAGPPYVPNEQDLYGRIRNVLESVLTLSDERVTFALATAGGKVLPPSMILRGPGKTAPLCLAVTNAEGNSLAACVKNLLGLIREGKQARRAVLLRCGTCKPAGKRTADNLAELERLGGVVLLFKFDEAAGANELAVLNALYDTLVAIEERDLSIGNHCIDKRQFAQWVRTEGAARRSQYLRSAAVQFPPLERVLGARLMPDAHADVRPRGPHPAPPNNGSERLPATTARTAPSVAGAGVTGAGPSAPASTPPVSGPPPSVLAADVVVGSRDNAGSQAGLLGVLKHDRQKVAVGFSKPMCAVVLGYMGSGKSYALGVLMENALLKVTNVTANDRPMAVVAFNYRRNPEARFEYAGFTRPNNKAADVERLRREYLAEPAGIDRLNVLGYGPEIARRSAEYTGLTTLPIQFRADELTADHWEILMKPPNAQAEYMEVVRDVIRTLFYAGRLSFKTLEQAVLTDERLTPAQRRRAQSRLSFARQWLADDRPYEWADLLAPGTMNVVDLRMQSLPKEDALRLCLVVTDLVRRTRNGVNKMVVFDEAHEYVDCKLENAITQIRHDGLSFVLASQYPQRIPETIFKYLLTRLIFELPDLKAINTVRRAAPNLDSISPQQVSRLGLEAGMCLIQTDDDCTDPLLSVPQLITIRPRYSQHGGKTLRNVAPTSVV